MIIFGIYSILCRTFILINILDKLLLCKIYTGSNLGKGGVQKLDPNNTNISNTNKKRKKSRNNFNKTMPITLINTHCSIKSIN